MKREEARKRAEDPFGYGHRARAVRSRKFRIWAGFSQPGPRSEKLTGNAVLTQIAELPEAKG